MGHGDGGVCCSKVNTKVSLGGAFAPESDVFGLHLSDECVDDIICRCVDEQVIDVDNDEQVVTKEKAGVELGCGKSTSFKAFSEVGEEVLGCLAEAIE